MRLTFLGGAEEIGASCAIVDVGDDRLMIDCGQRVGASAGEALPDFSPLEHGPPITAVLLTHAHADHIGALPAFNQHLPPGCPIYATEPTLAIAKVMLDDSQRIMAIHRNGDGDLPLFPPQAVRGVIERFRPVRWGKAERVGEGDLQATWYPSGHILGAAMIHLRCGEQSLVFSGDLSVADQRSVPGVFVPSIRPHTLVLESTYGNRLHAHRPSQERRIVERVAQTIAAGGHVLFPSFALGRAQEVLLVLGQAMRNGDLPYVPIFADGLVRSIARVYSRFPDDLATECRRLWAEGLDPIFPEDLPIQPVRRNESREDIAGGGPCVVVASSGMLQGGASLFYAKQWISDPRNLIVLTGYQDEESPGQALLDLTTLPAGQPRFFHLEGVRREVHCQVENLQLSAHADNGELVSIATKLKPELILLVHGDRDARTELARSLMAHSRAMVELPNTLSEYDVGENESVPSGARRSPLSHWPPWDPSQPQPLDLARFHEWLDNLDPRPEWLTLDELAGVWRSELPYTEDDRRQLREAVYGQPQRYFRPDPKRPYMLQVVPGENLRTASQLVRRSVEEATQVLQELFPHTGELVRYGFFPAEGVVELTFRFPRAAKVRFIERLHEFDTRTGWTHRFVGETDDSQLREVLNRWLPPDTPDVPTLEIRHDLGEVSLPRELVPNEEDESSVAERFFHVTGYRLNWTGSDGHTM